MTGLITNATVAVADAGHVAHGVATAADITIGIINTVNEWDDANALSAGAWHPSPSNLSLRVGVMRVVSSDGSYLSGTYVGPRLIGISVGLYGPPREQSMHRARDTRGREVCH